MIYQPPQLQVKLLPTEIVYSGKASVTEIKQFIYNEMHCLVGHRTTANKDPFPAHQVIVLYNVDFIKDPNGTDYVRNRVIKVAQKLKADGIDLTFAISNAREFRNELTELGISSPSDYKKYIIARGPNNQKYAFDGEYDESSTYDEQDLPETLSVILFGIQIMPLLSLEAHRIYLNIYFLCQVFVFVVLFVVYFFYAYVVVVYFIID